MERQQSVYFPSTEVLREIQKIAKEQKRGIGFVICEYWLKMKKAENIEPS